MTAGSWQAFRHPTATQKVDKRLKLSLGLNMTVHGFLFLGGPVRGYICDGIFPNGCSVHQKLQNDWRYRTKKGATLDF